LSNALLFVEDGTSSPHDCGHSSSFGCALLFQLALGFGTLRLYFLYLIKDTNSVTCFCLLSTTFYIVLKCINDNWVPVTTAWRVLRLSMEERPPIRRVGANVLNKQSRTADKGWSYSLGLGEVLTTPHYKKYPVTNHSQRPKLRLD